MTKFKFLLILLCIASDAQAQKFSSGGRSSGSISRPSTSSFKPSSPSRSSTPSPSYKPSSSSTPKSSYTPSTPKPSYTPSASSHTPSTPSKPTSSWYSSDSSSDKPKTTSNKSSDFYSSSNTSSKPEAKSSFGSDAVRNQSKQESKYLYQKSYKTPSGEEKQYKPSDYNKVETVKKAVPKSKYDDYDRRADTFYRRYPTYTPSPSIHYNDSFSPFFMGYLLANANNNNSATWIYHHRDSIDDRRYKELVADNAELEAKIKALEAANTPKDPNYVPTEFKDDPDLMYDKEFVKKAYEEDGSSGSWLATLIIGFIIGFIIVVIITIVVKLFSSKPSKFRHR